MQTNIRFSETRGMQLLGVGMRPQQVSSMQLVSANLPEGSAFPLEPPPPFAFALRPNWTRYGRVRWGEAPDFRRRIEAVQLAPSLSPNLISPGPQSKNGGIEAGAPPIVPVSRSINGTEPQAQPAPDSDAPPADPCLTQFLTTKLTPHNYSILITTVAQLHFTLSAAGVVPIMFMGSLLGSWRHHDIIPVHIPPGAPSRVGYMPISESSSRSTFPLGTYYFPVYTGNYR